MKTNFKIFLKYLFNFKGFIEGFLTEIQRLFEPKRFSIILFLISCYFFYKRNNLVSAIFLFLSLIIHLRNVYKGGEHIHWYRKKQGIKTKKEIENIKND